MPLGYAGGWLVVLTCMEWGILKGYINLPVQIMKM